MAVKRKIVKKKAVKKTVRKKPAKRKVVKRKAVKRKAVKKKVIRKKAVKKKIVRKKSTVKRRTVTNTKPKKRGAVMAKRKKSTAKKSVRRRRSNGAGKQKAMTVLTNVALAIGGALGASMLVAKVPVKDPRIKALIPLGLGVFGAMKAKKAMMRSAALGIAFSGGMGLVKTQFPNIPMLAGEDETYLPDGYQENAMLGVGDNDYTDDDIDSMLDSDMSGMQTYAGMQSYAGGDWVTSDDM